MPMNATVQATKASRPTRDDRSTTTILHLFPSLNRPLDTDPSHRHLIENATTDELTNLQTKQQERQTCVQSMLERAYQNKSQSNRLMSSDPSWQETFQLYTHPPAIVPEPDRPSSTSSSPLTNGFTPPASLRHQATVDNEVQLLHSELKAMVRELKEEEWPESETGEEDGTWQSHLQSTATTSVSSLAHVLPIEVPFRERLAAPATQEYLQLIQDHMPTAPERILYAKHRPPFWQVMYKI